MTNDHFQGMRPLFESLIDCGKLLQRRTDAIARLHAAHAEVKAAQISFHQIDHEAVVASLVVAEQYGTYFPFEWDEQDGSCCAL